MTMSLTNNGILPAVGRILMEPHPCFHLAPGPQLITLASKQSHRLTVDFEASAVKQYAHEVGAAFCRASDTSRLHVSAHLLLCLSYPAVAIQILCRCFRWQLMSSKILLRSTEWQLWVSATWRLWLWRACRKTAQMSCVCPTNPSTRWVAQPLHCVTCQTSLTGEPVFHCFVCIAYSTKLHATRR